MKLRLTIVFAGVVLISCVGFWLTLHDHSNQSAQHDVIPKAITGDSEDLTVVVPNTPQPGFALMSTQVVGLTPSVRSTNDARFAPQKSVVAAATKDPVPKKRVWDSSLLASLRNAAEQDPIQFELVQGQIASGTIDRLERSNGNVRYVSGRLSTPEVGRFFFQEQTMPGDAGPFVGIVEFPASGRAYRIESPGAGLASELVERSLNEVVCLNLPKPRAGTNGPVERIPPLNTGDFPDVPIPVEQQGIVVLESLPGSTPVIYLDFQGGYTPTWGGIAYQRSSFDNQQIRDLWGRVAEDFVPFNINVTTYLKAFQNAPENSRQRVIITPTDLASPGSGGVAYLGSFSWTGDTPCWVFVTSSPKDCAQACSHEAGHALGLSHDGQLLDGALSEYYEGQGSGETGWAPIMGVGYYENVTQWSRGEYNHANNLQPQLEMIASRNNVHFRADDAGETLATSRYLDIDTNGVAFDEGVIETSGDSDAFQFTTAGGAVSFRADPAKLSPNLAIELSLYDAGDTLLVSDDPQKTLSASLSANLPAGTYTVRVTGSGRNDPLLNGFSDYGSLGYYAISGSVENPRLSDRFVIPENLANGSIIGVVPARNSSGDPLGYTIRSGDTNHVFAIDNSGTLSVADQTYLDYETLARDTQHPVQFELFVDISDTSNPFLSETNRRVVVTVTNVNEAPVITGFAGPSRILSSGSTPPATNVWQETDCLSLDCDFATSVIEHTPPGTVIGRIIGSDPDFYTVLSYSIVSGNEGGMFSMDRESGTISVIGDLIAATQNVYHLAIVVSDQTPPEPLLATSRVTINVQLPYPIGSIAYAVYPNIPGTLVSALTDDSRFPNDPAFEEQATLFERNSNEQGAFGAVMRGYLLPPGSGRYTFWIASRDNSELLLGNTTNPASATRIAWLSGEGNSAGPGEWTKYPGQQSEPVALAAGRAYYIEARLKAGTETNYLAVAWECNDIGLAQQVIPGDYLAPYSMNYVPHPLGFDSSLHQDAFAGTLVGTVSVADVNPGDVETLAIISGNEDGLFLLDPATGAIRLVSDVALQSTDRTNYTLQVQASDNGVPPLSGVATATVSIVPPNTITVASLAQEVWTNISGTSVGDLTSQAKYPQRPDMVRVLAAFDSGMTESSISQTNDGTILQVVPSLGSAYGSRIRAFVTPLESGLYTFFISSRDDSYLLFGSATNPAAAKIIAYIAGGATDYHEWTRYTSQQSGAQWLEAGTRYYLESLHKTGGPLAGQGGGVIFGGDHVSVAWTGPGIPGTNVIDSSFLTPIDIEYPPALADKSIKLPITATNGALVTTMQATDSAADTLAYRIVSGNESGTFAIDPANGNLLVTDNSLFASGVLSNFNLAIQVQDSGYGGLYPLRSSQAMLSIQVVDTTPPFQWTGGGSDGNWSTPENWRPGVPREADRLSFGGAVQPTNHNNLLTSVGTVTLMNGGFFIDGNPLVLKGGLASHGNNTWAINSTLGTSQNFTNYYGTFVLLGSLNNAGYNLTSQISGTIRVGGAVSGSGGLFKSGPGNLVLNARNSYSGPTVVSEGTLVLTDPGSIDSSSRIQTQNGSVFDGRGLTNGLVIPPGQTLRGVGTMLGLVTVNGTLALDRSQYGTLTFSNRLVLAGTTTLLISRTDSEQSVASARVAGELDLGGTLIISNSNSSVVLGRTIKIFDAAHLSGDFENVQFQIQTNGLQWDISRLAVDGTLRVTAAPPHITVARTTGSAISIRFQTATGLNYVLETTSTPDQPSTWTTYATVSGTGAVRLILFPIGQSVPQRFLRVRAY